MSNTKTRLHRLLNRPAFLRPEYLGFASLEIIHPDNTVTVVAWTPLQPSATVVAWTPLQPSASPSQMLAEHPLFGSQQHNEPSR